MGHISLALCIGIASPEDKDVRIGTVVYILAATIWTGGHIVLSVVVLPRY